jgi:hypothetical protein
VEKIKKIRLAEAKKTVVEQEKDESLNRNPEERLIN